MLVGIIFQVFIVMGHHDDSLAMDFGIVFQQLVELFAGVSVHTDSRLVQNK